MNVFPRPVGRMTSVLRATQRRTRSYWYSRRGGCSGYCRTHPFLQPPPPHMAPQAAQGKGLV
jgi:hypothetical protein